MIVHVVLFEPRQDLTAAEHRAVLSDLQHTAAAVASIRRFRVGRRVRHGLPGYEQAMMAEFSYAAIIEFDDEDGLKAYLQDSAHHAIGTHFATAAARAIAYDYRMKDVSEPMDWLTDET